MGRVRLSGEVLEMRIDAITVCVDYAKYLKMTISNKVIFDSWTIVTVDRDKETQQLCRDNNLPYVISDRLYADGAPFAKARAINDALSVVSPTDWVALVDADIYLYPEAFKAIRETVRFNPDCLYALNGRVLVDDYDHLLATIQRNDIKRSELIHADLLAGFFHMWHSSIREFYPEEGLTAGLDDIIMRDSFSVENLKVLPTFGVHIGEMWVNHTGVSPQFPKLLKE